MQQRKIFGIFVAMLFVAAYAAESMAQTKGAPSSATKATQSAGGQQQSLSGYTDEKGELLPGGDTIPEFGDVGPDGKHTVTLRRLYAYSDRLTEDAPNNRLAEFAKNPEYFRGAKVYIMNLGEAYGETGRLAKDVDLANAIAVGEIGTNDSVSFRVPKGKFDCRPVNWVLKLSKPDPRVQSDQVWLGHPGWAKTNKRTGKWAVLVATDQKPEGDERYPATVWCFDGNKVVPMRAETKEKFSKYIQPPGPMSEEYAKRRNLEKQM